MKRAALFVILATILVFAALRTFGWNEVRLVCDAEVSTRPDGNPVGTQRVFLSIRYPDDMVFWNPPGEFQLELKNEWQTTGVAQKSRDSMKIFLQEKRESGFEGSLSLISLNGLVADYREYYALTCKPYKLAIQ